MTKEEKEYAEKSLSKGYYLYVYYSIHGYYCFKAVDPNYVDIEIFKKRYAYGRTLYSSCEEVQKELDRLNKNCCKYNLRQKAEEYAEKMHFKRLYGHKPVVMKELLSAYIAGATENSILLHDLRKDPKDLPKEDVTVLLLTEVEPVTARYDLKYEAFFRMNEELNYCIFIAPMSYVAWCEIPRFKE